MKNIQNGLIESTHLGYEDHNILTCWLHLKFEGTGQGFGGFTLDNWKEPEKKRVGTAYGMDFIIKILEVVGVRSWEDLKGKHVRVKREGDDWGPIIAIGHIIEDKWFEPKVDLANHFTSLLRGNKNE